MFVLPVNMWWSCHLFDSIAVKVTHVNTQCSCLYIDVCLCFVQIQPASQSIRSVSSSICHTHVHRYPYRSPLIQQMYCNRSSDRDFCCLSGRSSIFYVSIFDLVWLRINWVQMGSPLQVLAYNRAIIVIRVY